jgi:hypothetical protein
MKKNEYYIKTLTKNAALSYKAAFFLIKSCEKEAILAVFLAVHWIRNHITRK